LFHFLILNFTKVANSNHKINSDKKSVFSLKNTKLAKINSNKVKV